MADEKKPAEDQSADSTSEQEATQTDTVSPDDIADAVVIEEPEDGAANTGDHPDDASRDEEAAVTDDEPTDPEGPVDAPETPDSTAPVAHPEPETRRKGGFLPLLIGGVIAGGIGFGTATYLDQQAGEDASAVAALSEEVETLRGEMQSLDARAQLSDLTAAQEALSTEIDDLSARLDQATGEFNSLEDRLTAMEKRPADEAASAAVEAYKDEFNALMADLATQREAIEAMSARAAEQEAEAQQIAQATMQRAALTRIRSALESGAPYAAALGDLEAAGMTVPEPVARFADDGAPTLVELQASFPDAARAALAKARRLEAAEGENPGIGSFLKTQLGVRSLEPQEGTSADAVLSRAEAAVRDGRLNDALAEIETLPEDARAELTEWAGAATDRLAIMDAVEALSHQIDGS